MPPEPPSKRRDLFAPPDADFFLVPIPVKMRREGELQDAIREGIRIMRSDPLRLHRFSALTFYRTWGS